MNASGNSPDSTLTFVISVAAELAGMHPQTLRQYDRLGLVIPARTKGHGRRYSARDIQRLRTIQRLSQEEGINLEGIKRILDLERRVEKLEEERDRLAYQLAVIDERQNRVFAASSTGEVHSLRRGQRQADVAVRRSAQRHGVDEARDGRGEGVRGGSGELAVWRGMSLPLSRIPVLRPRPQIEAAPRHIVIDLS